MPWQDLLWTVGALAPGAGALLVLSTGWLRSVRELKVLPVLEPAPLKRPLCVIIPARNEGAGIRATLEALLDDPAPELRVLVFDDGSTDDTAAVVEEVREQHRARLRLVQGKEEPRDGFGKPLALHRAVEALEGEHDLLLFLDADVKVAPGSLGGLVAFLEESGVSAVSGAPTVRCESWVEKLTVPAFVSAVGARFPPGRVNDDDDPTAFLNGQVILVRREALDAVGGWASVKDSVLEDVALGRRLKAAGHRLRVVDLRERFSTRMYASWSEIVQGFGKNAVEIHGSPGGTLAFGLFAALVSWAPWVSLALALALAPAAAGVAGLMLLGVLSLQMHLREQAGVPGPTAVLNPLTYLAVLRVYGAAAWRAWRGGRVEWKGRSYPAAPPSGVRVPELEPDKGVSSSEK